MKYVESLNLALRSLLEERRDVYLLGEDILDPYGGAFRVTKGLSTLFPDRVLTTPISEASISGFALGMALNGFRPIVEIMFGDFLTLCTDQIVNSATKFNRLYNEQVAVPLVIRTPMGGRRGYGATHSQTLETLYLGVPGLKIVAPSHYHSPGDLLRSSVIQATHPVLFVENKLLYPEALIQPDGNGRAGEFFLSTISNHDTEFPTVHLSLANDEPPDVLVIAYGGMAPLAAQAAFNVFMREEILVDVLIPSVVKPIPLDDLIGSVRAVGRVVIAEEGVRTSGWGAEVASLIYENAFQDLKRPISRIGAREMPIPSARSLEAQVLPQAVDIETTILEQMG